MHLHSSIGSHQHLLPGSFLRSSHSHHGGAETQQTIQSTAVTTAAQPQHQQAPASTLHVVRNNPYHHHHHHPGGFYFPHHHHQPPPMLYLARQLVQVVPTMPAAVFIPSSAVQKLHQPNQPTTSGVDGGVMHHRFQGPVTMTANTQYRQDSERDPSMEGMTVVWNWNLRKEFMKVSQLVKCGKYNHIGMDTEFPGFIYKNSNFRGSYDRNRPYRIFKANVDSMRVIQLGITFFDSDGNLCPGTHTWQFNFCFDIK
jgi:hypothetical protein